jgi:hypothetical protein
LSITLADIELCQRLLKVANAMVYAAFLWHYLFSPTPYQHKRPPTPRQLHAYSKSIFDQWEAAADSGWSFVFRGVTYDVFDRDSGRVKTRKEYRKQGRKSSHGVGSFSGSSLAK